MKTRLLILIFLLLSVHLIYGQKKKVPKDIKEAIAYLQTDCPDSLKTIIKKTSNDSLLNLCFPWGGDYKTISNWTTGRNSTKKTKLEKYFSEFGITYSIHIETIVLITFKAFLNKDSISQDKIIQPFQLVEKKWAKEDSVRFTTDSLRGVYIPKDLEDCLIQIDKFWSDSTKMKVRQWTEDEFSGKAHLSFGMWMRNNWQLWGGSRLSKYFNDKGVYHPDDMSGIILYSYHRHLTGKEIKLDEQIKYYQNYWKGEKAPTKEIFPKKSGKLEFKSSMLYKSKTNGQGTIHIGRNNKSKDIWIYDFYLGWAKISDSELSELENADQDTREEIAIKIYANNK